MKVFLLLLLVSTGYCLDKVQIKGLKSLLKNLDGAYATCQLVLFSVSKIKSTVALASIVT